MRKRGLAVLYELAKQHQQIVYIGSDVGKGTLSEFQAEMPERFFVEGISEAYVVGMAAGMAMNGKIPFVNTISTFLSRRAHEQIAVDICLGNHPVRIYANGGGLVYGPLGPTHQAIEDIALMRALPNMTVVAPSDADEMERLVRASVDYPGPIYIRVARGGDPIVSKPNPDFAIGRAELDVQPGELLFVTTGVMRQVGLSVIETLAKSGVKAGLVHCHTVKPLDSDILDPLLRETPAVISLEEHTICGGLGSAVAERIARGARHPKGRFEMVGIPDVFSEMYGRQGDQFAHLGLDHDAVLKAAQKLLA